MFSDHLAEINLKDEVNDPNEIFDDLGISFS